MRNIAAILIISIIVIGGALYFLKGEEEQTPTLKILNYSEYMDPEVLTSFEQEYGVKIIYDEYEAAEEAWAKLKAGGGDYDVMIIAHSYVGLAKQMGLLLPLDHDKIPNLVNLDPTIASHPADPNQEYAVPYMWGTTGIAYVSTCVDNPPDTWSTFYNASYLSNYSGKASLLSEFSEVVMTTMLSLGYDPSKPENWNENVLTQVETKLSEIKSYLVGFYGASQYMPALQSEQVCLAQAWSGDVLVVQEENPNVQFINPKDGALFWVDYIVVPKNSAHPDLAYAFINYLLRPEVAAKNVKYVWYASAVKKDLLVQYAEETNDSELLSILENPLVYPPSDTNLVPSPVLTEEMSQQVETIRLHVLGG